MNWHKLWTTFASRLETSSINVPCGDPASGNPHFTQPWKSWRTRHGNPPVTAAEIHVWLRGNADPPSRAPVERDSPEHHRQNDHGLVDSGDIYAAAPSMVRWPSSDSCPAVRWILLLAAAGPRILGPRTSGCPATMMRPRRSPSIRRAGSSVHGDVGNLGEGNGYGNHETRRDSPAQQRQLPRPHGCEGTRALY